MNWKIDWEENLMIVSVAGRLVARFASEFRDEVLSKMTPKTDVLFDLSQMNYIDSSGLGALVQILQKAKSNGRRVVLTHIQPGPKIVFDITKVSKVFEIAPQLSDVQF